MANELAPHAEWQKLSDLYRAMSDDEVLALAADLDDLTDVARDVLRSEMASRGLQAMPGPPEEAGFPMLPRRVVELRDSPAQGLAQGTISLMTFHDAIAARQACDYLEQDDIGIEMRDVSTPQSTTGSFYGGPPVALQVIVQHRDQPRAVAILREKMGLFPVQEVEVADEPIDDGTTATLGNFGHRNEADEVAQILGEAGLWNRIVANAEGTVEDQDCYTLEVKEIDLARAGEVVERAMGSAEG